MRQNASKVVLLAALVVLLGGPACINDQGAQAAGKRNKKGKAGKAGDAEVVAQVGGRSITLEELDAKAIEAGIAPYQQLFDARSKALDGLIADMLLEAEAEARGMTREALVEQEITQKQTPVTDDSIRAFFDQNQNRMRGRAYEDVQGAIREFLETQSSQTAFNDYVGQLREKADVQIKLDPPRVPVIIADNDPSKGPEGAPITIVEYSDFQ